MRTKGGKWKGKREKMAIKWIRVDGTSDAYTAWRDRLLAFRRDDDEIWGWACADTATGTIAYAVRKEELQGELYRATLERIAELNRRKAAADESDLPGIMLRIVRLEQARDWLVEG